MQNLDRHAVASYILLFLSALLAIAALMLPIETLDTRLVVGSLCFFLGAALAVSLLRNPQESRDLPSVLTGLAGIAGLLVLKFGSFPGAFGVGAFCVVLCLSSAFVAIRSRASRRSK